MPFPFFPVIGTIEGSFFPWWCFVLAYLASIWKCVMWCLSTFVCVWMWPCVSVLILYLVWDRISWSLPFSLAVERLWIPNVPRPVSVSHLIIRTFGLQTFATLPGFYGDSKIWGFDSVLHSYAMSTLLTEPYPWALMLMLNVMAGGKGEKRNPKNKIIQTHRIENCY